MTFDELHTLIYDNYSRKQLEYLDRQYIGQILDEEGQGLLSEDMKEVYNQLSMSRSGTSFTPQKRVAGQLGLIFFEEALFRKLEEKMSPEVHQVFRELIFRDFLDEQSMLEEFSIPVKKKKQSFSTQSLLLPEFLIFPNKTEYQWSPGIGSDQQYSFYFPREMRLFFSRYVELPPEFTLQPIQEPTKGAYNYQDEGTIFSELPMIRLYDQNGDIKMSKRDRPLASTFNPMRKKLGIQEFFPSNDKVLQSVRTALLTHFWKTLYRDEFEELMGLDLLVELMKEYWKDRLNVVNLLFHLQGQNGMPTYYRSNVSHTMKVLLTSLPDGAWVKIDNLVSWARFQGLPLAGISESVAKDVLFFKDQRGKKVNISPGLYRQFVELPSLYACCFLLGALGLLDIRYDPPNTELLGKTWYSPFDGLSYIRLTELGAFLSDRRQDYEPPEIEEISSFSLSDSHLHILVLNGANPARLSVLNRIARSLSSRRFEVDASTFLTSCYSSQDLERSISLFRQNIEEHPPQIWEDFFTRLRNNAHLLKKQSGWIVYALPDDRELIHQVVHDPKLKSLSIKAEQYRVLVQEENHDAFVERLKELGYLL
ncbi:MAG: hypothetical protein AAF587_05465 [Bacteroidota bacterium]